MFTYLWIKQSVEECFDFESLFINFFILPFICIFDILLILFQPLFYYVYKLWVKENDCE